MMKNIYYLLTIFGILFFTACRKDDNPKLPDLIKAPVPLFTLDESSADTRIINGATFTSTFTLGLYFPDDTRPQKADILVAMNGEYDNVKVLKGNITTFPSTITVTAEEMASVFGLVAADLPEATTFELRAQFTTANGTVIPVFNSVGKPYGTDLQNLPGSSLTLNYEVPCELIMSNFTGEFEVVTDEWEDYHAGDIVNVTLIDATHLSFEYAADDAHPIVVTVNPATFETSVEKVYYGNYGPGYDFSAESVPGSKANIIGTCDNSISVRLQHTTPTDDYGAYTIKIKKKN